MTDLTGPEATRISRRDKRADRRNKAGMRPGAAKMLRTIADARDKRDARLLVKASRRHRDEAADGA